MRFVKHKIAFGSYGKIKTWYIDAWDAAGRRVRRSLNTTSKKIAEQRYDEWRTGNAEDTLSEPSQKAPLIRDVVSHYTDVYLPNKGSAVKTLTKANQVLYDFIRFMASRNVGRVDQLTAQHIDAWAADARARKLAAKTVKNNIGSVRACLNAAVDRGMLDTSPVKKWLLPTVPDPEIYPLTLDQLRRVLVVIGRDRPQILNIVSWIAYTGNRPSDACGLKWREVNLEAQSVQRVQVKTKRLNSYEISPPALALVLNEKARGVESETVFTTAHGTAFTVNKLYHDFTRTISAAGFERAVNLKDLRHTFGSLMANEFHCPLPVLQRLMGHTDIKTTMQYIRPSSGAEYVLAMGEAMTTENAPTAGNAGKKTTGIKRKP